MIPAIEKGFDLVSDGIENSSSAKNSLKERLVKMMENGCEKLEQKK